MPRNVTAAAGAMHEAVAVAAQTASWCKVAVLLLRARHRCPNTLHIRQALLTVATTSARCRWWALRPVLLFAHLLAFFRWDANGGDVDITQVNLWFRRKIAVSQCCRRRRSLRGVEL